MNTICINPGVHQLVRLIFQVLPLDDSSYIKVWKYSDMPDGGDSEQDSVLEPFSIF